MRLSHLLIPAIAAATLTTTSIASADGHLPAHHQLARDILEESISYRTAEGHEQIPAMTAALVARLKAAGFTDDDIQIIPQQVQGETTNSLIVRYRGDGSLGKKGIGLMAHMDVVDALPADWERDPFTLIEEDGFFFGRGTSDNKAGMSLIVTTFIRLKQEGFVPGRDLVLAFSGDEETQMQTAINLAENYSAAMDVEYMINSDGGGGLLDTDGKPVFTSIQAAEKTYVDYQLEVRNPGGHSSRPTASNAIYDLASALKNIEAYKFPVRTNAITLGYFAEAGKFTPGELGQAMIAFAANPKDQDAIDYLRANPGTVGTTGTTCVATMLDAGHAPNALPQRATANVNCRVFPGVPLEDVRQQLIRVIDNDEVTVTQTNDANSAPASDIPEEYYNALRAYVDRYYPGMPIVPVMSSGATDGTHYRNAGVPTIGGSGIMMRSEDVYAHGLNERIPVKGYYQSADFWYEMVKDIASPQ